MKNLLFALLLLIPAIGFAQNTAPRISNSEKFVEEPGRILEKEMSTMGVIPVKYNLQKQELNVNALVMKDLLTSKKSSCLVFELIKKTKYAYVDPDEISDILNMFKLMDEQYIGTTKPNYTELVYNTRGGTEIGCFFDQGRWIVFIRLDKNDKNTIIEINTDDLITLRSYILRVDNVVNSAK